MKKISFFVFIIITTITYSTQLITMEIITPKKFFVLLDISKMSAEEAQQSLGQANDVHSKHACEILGIPWEENNNKYKTDAALIGEANDINAIDRKNSWYWETYLPPFLPRTTKQNPASLVPDYIGFPKILPASFIEKLEKEKIIVLQKGQFEIPIEISISINKIEKRENIQNAANTLLCIALNKINQSAAILNKENPSMDEATKETIKTEAINQLKEVHLILQAREKLLYPTNETPINTDLSSGAQTPSNTTSTNLNESKNDSPKEESASSTTTETPQFIVTLHLKEITEKYKKQNKSFDKQDEYACTVLGIAWEENNNNYQTTNAYLRKSNENSILCDWLKPHPQGIPFSTITNSDYSHPHEVRFPESLPAEFVKRLEKEKSITLTNTLFATPVEIIVTLGSITKLPQSNLQTVLQSNTNNYIFYRGLTIFAFGLLIAWLLYHKPHSLFASI